MGNLDKLTNKQNSYSDIGQILHESKEKGVYFKLSHFLVFLYRVSIISFHHKRSPEFLNEYKNANNIKKLLYFLRQLEISDGFQNRNWSHTSYMLKNSTFIPPNELLLKYLNEEDMAVVENVIHTNEIKNKVS
jgi:hypothetical protein